MDKHTNINTIPDPPHYKKAKPSQQEGERKTAQEILDTTYYPAKSELQGTRVYLYGDVIQAMEEYANQFRSESTDSKEAVEFAEWLKINCSETHDGFQAEEGKWFYYFPSGAINQKTTTQLYELYANQSK